MKRPQFHCDHCGRVVGLHDSVCAGCGKTFDAVKCPQCGHQGPPANFVAGCPSCRYLAPASTPTPRSGLFTPVMSVLLVLLTVAVALSWFLRKG